MAKPQSSDDRRTLLDAFGDSRWRLLALVVLVLETFLLAVLVQAGKAEWYVVVVGVLPLALIIIGVLFYPRTREKATANINKQVKMLKGKLVSASFDPHLIIGLARGGLVVAARLSREYDRDPPMPIISLWPHRRDYDNPLNSVNLRAIHEMQNGSASSGHRRTWNILIVDDACQSGRSLDDARGYVLQKLDGISCRVETAALELKKGVKKVIEPSFIAERPDHPQDIWGNEEEP